MRMVLNLGILNILLLIPTLSDQYNIGPSEVSLTNNPTMKIGTLKKHNKKPAIARSKMRFIFLSATDPHRHTQTFFQTYIKEKIISICKEKP